MRRERTWGSRVQSSWLAMALAGALAVTTPVTASLVGADANGSALPVPRPRGEVATGLPRGHEAAGARAALTEEPGRAPNARRVEPAWEPHLLVNARPGLEARAHPWNGAPVVAQVPSASRYYHAPLRLWVEETRRDGTWGLVEIPYAWPHERGWIPLDGLKVHRSRITVRVDLSERLVRVYRGEHLLRRFPAAIGAPASPTPPGDYVVTDRVPFSPDSALGSFAFGISGIQPRLPAGWSGGDQLAIHGTNAPWTIGTAASAGCIRVSETALRALLPLLRPGTPISVRP